jgi:hypothetical protein
VHRWDVEHHEVEIALEGDRVLAALPRRAADRRFETSRSPRAPLETAPAA